MAVQAAGGSRGREGGEAGAPDDLLRLEDFTDTDLLRCLRLRYERDRIYTWVGSVLVSVNPYRDIGVFDESVAARYAEAARCPSLGAHLEPTSRCPDVPPHLFAAVAGALASPGRSHALLISGESGAGKTEATRASLAFLARHCSAADRVRDRLLHSSPVLEAFGNAQTRQNSNSSRFGKFIEVHISSGCKLVGATLRPYMLEASRVAGTLPRNERTYHIFYYFRAALSVLSGTVAPEGSLWDKLRRSPEWEHVARVGGPALAASPRLQQGPPAAECLEAFEHLYEQLLGAGMSCSEVAECARVVAAVGALAEEQLGAAPGAASKLGATMQELLGVPPEQLNDFFANVEITVGGSRERLVRCRSGAEAKTLQSSLAQELYAALFLHVARLVARGIAPPPEARGGKILGLLDLYGFEVFDSNGFEQFLINYCNERIQQLFNRQVFLSEATEYSAEGLDADGQWQRLASACRLPALTLLEGELGGFAGIFGVVNDRSRCGFDAGGDGSEVVEAITAACGSHPALRRPAREAARIFGVAHFAGEVFYEAKQFVHKNASSHRPDIVVFLRRHGSPFVQGLFENGAEGGCAGSVEVKPLAVPTASPAPPGRRRLLTSTLISAFRSELSELCTALEARECRHVRCLRPNDCQAPSFFDSSSMLRQCRYSGLLEATRIRRYGYAHRRNLVTFAQRYATILFELRRAASARGLAPPPRLPPPGSAGAGTGAPSADVARPSCTAICLAMRSGGVSADEVCAGRTKIFLKEAALDWLEAARRRAAVTILAATARARSARRRFTGFRRTVVRMQTAFRLRRAWLEKASAAAATLQRWWFGCLDRARRRQPPPPPEPVDEEQWKALRRAAWVTTTSMDNLHAPAEHSTPSSARSLRPRGSGNTGAPCAHAGGCSVPGCQKRRTPRSIAAGAIGLSTSGRPRFAGRRGKENEEPKAPAPGCRKLAEAARGAVAAVALNGMAATLAVPRHRATSPTSRSAAAGTLSRRQALRALSPVRGTDRLQAQLLRVGRALRDREVPQEKAEMLEDFLETLLPACAVATAPTPARFGRSDRGQRAAAALLQPPWKPSTIIAQPMGSFTRCRSAAKFDFTVAPGSARGASPGRREASPPPPPAAAAVGESGAGLCWEGPDAAGGLGLSVAAYGADAFTFASVARQSPYLGSQQRSPSPSARPPIPRAAAAVGRQPLSIRWSSGTPR